MNNYASYPFYKHIYIDKAKEERSKQIDIDIQNKK
jgi:hypothetical protein